ncbi:MAG: ABC transporter ATP-binding protein [Planctomycetota bacterium]
MNSILNVRSLEVNYPKRGGGFVRAVGNISFDVAEGEIVALLGESGCGKSTTARAVARLLKPSAGEIIYNNKDLAPLEGPALGDARRGMQMVFQDPGGSLNSRFTVRKCVEEPLRYCKNTNHESVPELLAAAGLGAELIDRYPHELSGGQKQRVAIARALSINPRLLLLDEPTSALDVSVRAQIVNLLSGLRRARRIAMLLITHDFAVARSLADRVLIMRAGAIVEEGGVVDIFKNPRTPYTLELINAVPSADPAAQRAKLDALAGAMPTV